MKRAALLLVVALVGCKAKADFAFANAGRILPEDTAALPSGPNADLVTANCTGCHSAEMILTQPRLTQAAWEGEVAKMQKVYKAPVADADVAAIVAYLETTNAALTPESAPKPPPAPAECAASPCR